MRSSSRLSLAGATAAVILCGCAIGAAPLPEYTPQGPASVGVPTLRPLAIAKAAWKDLTPEEMERLRAVYAVKVLEDGEYGVIVDVQSQDQSAAGTNAGAALGGATASALYIDHALRGGNYSATGNLALGVLGAAVGSSMDRRPTTQFQMRYTVRQGDGELRYFDEVKATPFRHSVGVCVTVPDLQLASQALCKQTAAAVRERFLK